MEMKMNKMLKLINILRHTKKSQANIKCCSTVSKDESCEFETVFSFPSIKYISVMNRLKVYQILGTSIAIPSCGILESLNTVPTGAFLSACYIGLTGATVLSLATLPFKDTIGYLYISKDNKKVKISSMDFWGRRKDRIVSADEWLPLHDMTPNKMDAVYLTPKLSDGSKFKLFIKFGNVINSRKMGQVLE